MSSLACSHCGAPRQTAAAACPYCKALYGGPAPAGAPAAGALPADVAQALAAGNLIEAIRLYRAAYKVGLKEAKEAIERAAGRRPAL